MKVITFSEVFPGYHWRAGESTWFAEKIRYGLYCMKHPEKEIQTGPFWYPPKYHTIRRGHRWKTGETFSARYWTGNPYQSKQEEFSQLEIKKIWNIQIDENGVASIGLPGDQLYYLAEGEEYLLAQNDGLALDDFQSWFPLDKVFTGQIICWNDKIDYKTA